MLNKISSAALVAFTLLPATMQRAPAQDTWRAQVEEHRKRRDASLRDPFSPLALVHREYLDGRSKLTIGSGAGVDLRLAGQAVAPVHATLEVSAEAALARAARDTALQFPSPSDGVVREINLREKPQFRIDRFHFLFRANAPVRGAALEIYDSQDPALHAFRGLEFFPIEQRYRVPAEIIPRTNPPAVQLVDSAGQPRPYRIYGDLRFALDGKPVTMELYADTLDPAAIARNGFMLIFADQTSGKETYYAGRYLDIEGKLRGAVTVDFNLARNPPCNFSAAFTCPFPRAQNRLPVAIRAGEKAYRGKQPRPLQAVGSIR